MSPAVIHSTLVLLTVLALGLATRVQSAEAIGATCVWPETLDRSVASPPAPPLSVVWYCSPDAPEATPIKEYLRRLPASVTEATVSIEPGPEDRATASLVLSIYDEATGAARAETRVLELVRRQGRWEIMSDPSLLGNDPPVAWPVLPMTLLLPLAGAGIAVPVLLVWRHRRTGTRAA
jgi:hypothetical protein